MTRTAKVMAVLVGALLIVVCGTGIMVAGTAVTSGLMTVSIEEAGPDGLDLFIPLPAGLVDASLALAPVALRAAGHHGIDAELDRIHADLDELLPIASAMLDELADMPDAVLVEVEGDREYVRVSKEGRTIRILVEEGGDRIAIAVPARVLRSVGGFLSG